jgi:hypothetical protein
VNHHKDVGWSQWFYFRSLLSREVSCMILIAAISYQRDHVLFDRDDTQ